MNLDQFIEICKSKGLVEIENTNDEIVTYALKNGADQTLVVAVWDDCDKSDSSCVDVHLSTFHQVFSDFDSDYRSCGRADKEWLTDLLDNAIEAANEAEKNSSRTSLTLKELYKMLNSFRCDDFLDGDIGKCTFELPYDPKERAYGNISARTFFDRLLAAYRAT